MLSVARGPVYWALVGLGGLACAVAAHVATVFILPRHAVSDPFARMAATVQLGQFRLAALDDRTAPFRDAAMMRAVCRYDLGQGPLALAVEPLDASFATFGFYNRDGTAFYGLTVRATERSPFAVSLMTTEQKVAADAADTAEETVDALRIVAPGPDGFVIVDTPGDDADLAARNLAKIRCIPGRNLDRQP